MKQETVLLLESPEVSKETLLPENETQRILRDALTRLDGGRLWHQGSCISEDGTRTCAVTANGCALGRVNDLPYTNAKESPASSHLTKAARHLGATGPECLNDDAKSFSEVETMFRLAIAFAATPGA